MSVGEVDRRAAVRCPIVDTAAAEVPPTQLDNDLEPGPGPGEAASQENLLYDPAASFSF
jgi:hypothetical protein